MIRVRRMWTRFQEKSRCRLFEDDDEVHNDYNNEGENKDEDADDVPKKAMMMMMMMWRRFPGRVRLTS